MGQKILVAFDDSENAMRAVGYIASSFSNDHKITLLSIIPDTAAICDMNSPSLIPYFQERQAFFCAIEDENKELVEAALGKAKQVLQKAGFDEKNIITIARTRDKGVVRDILNEAKKGYSTIVVGRKGHSKVAEFIFGSVSQKILSLAKGVSVILVD